MIDPHLLTVSLEAAPGGVYCTNSAVRLTPEARGSRR